MSEDRRPPANLLRSKLHELVKTNRWDRVSKRIRMKRTVRSRELGSRSDLVEVFPNFDPPLEIEFHDENGDLPLHIALKEEAPLDIIQALIYGYVPAINARDKTGTGTLNLAIEQDSPVSIIRAILEADKDTARGSGDELPIALALGRDCHVDIINALIDAYPGSLTKPHLIMDGGGLPLHYACTDPSDAARRRTSMTENTENLITIIMERNPHALVVQDNSGSTPLHLVCERKPTFTLLKRMLDLAPMDFDQAPDNFDLTRLTDMDQQLPIHIAINYKASVTVIEELLKRYPEGAVHKGKDNYLPLHFATYHGCTLRILSILLKKNPAGVACITSNTKDTPLHLLFTDSNYSKKYTKSLDGSILGVEDMAKMMVKYYARLMFKDGGIAAVKRAMKRLLKGTLNQYVEAGASSYSKFSVIEEMENCSKKHPIPESLQRYLNEVASGKITDFRDVIIKHDEEDSLSSASNSSSLAASPSLDDKSNSNSSSHTSTVGAGGRHEKNLRISSKHRKENNPAVCEASTNSYRQSRFSSPLSPTSPLLPTKNKKRRTIAEEKVSEECNFKPSPENFNPDQERGRTDKTSKKVSTDSLEGNTSFNPIYTNGTSFEELQHEVITEKHGISTQDSMAENNASYNGILSENELSSDSSVDEKDHDDCSLSSISEHGNIQERVGNITDEHVEQESCEDSRRRNGERSKKMIWEGLATC